MESLPELSRSRPPSQQKPPSTSNSKHSVYAQLTILAPGLLGASLGMAVRHHRLAERITVWARRPEARLACAAEPWCDAALATPREAVAGADLVVLCTPVAANR